MNKKIIPITIIFLFLCFCMSCKLQMGYELLNKYPSPDNSQYVYVYSVNTGATSGYSYRVTISDTDDFDKVNKEKYFFNLDRNHNAASQKINVEWLGCSNIKVEYDIKARVFKQNRSFLNTIIEYDTY